MTSSPEMPSFEMGSVYRRREIHAAFGGQRQGGISTPAEYPAVFLFYGAEGNAYGYRDEWKEDGFFHYTGEGTAGDMTMARGNLAIKRHAEDSKLIMLFENLGKGQCRFRGYMEYVSHYDEMIPDRNGDLRRGLIFKLRSVGGVTGSERLALEFDRITLEALRGKAIDASRQVVDKATRQSTYRDRSRVVAAYVQKRAYGFCEGCGSPSPFQRQDGTPYLEAHHTQRVSDDGPDAPAHVLALCPTCHSRVHHSSDGRDYNRSISGLAVEMEKAIGERRVKVVTAALICDTRDRVFVAERAYGELAGLWEFPGGKVKDDESPERCLRREIREELGIQLHDVLPFVKVDHDYGTFLIRLLCFRCRTSQNPSLAVHRTSRWVGVGELGQLALAPADAKVAAILRLSRACR